MSELLKKGEKKERTCRRWGEEREGVEKGSKGNGGGGQDDRKWREEYRKGGMGEGRGSRGELEENGA